MGFGVWGLGFGAGCARLVEYEPEQVEAREQRSGEVDVLLLECGVGVGVGVGARLRLGLRVEAQG